MRYAALWYSAGQWLAALGAAFVQWLTMAVTRPSEARLLWEDLLASPRRIRRRASRRFGAGPGRGGR
jgi:hypothetical protein